MARLSDGRVKITKRVVDALLPGEVRWDKEVRGFGVRCQRRAKKYVLKCRINRKQRWFTIGEHGSPWTPDNARKEAVRLLGNIHSGSSVGEIRKGNKSEPTVVELCGRFIEDYALQHKKSSAIVEDRRNIKNHIVPLLGGSLVSEVTREDIDTFKRAVRDGKTAPKNGNGHRSGYRGGAVVSGGPGVANRCLALLSKMFNLAERWGLRADGTNPVRHVERYKENKVERYLSTEELERLASTLTELEQTNVESPFVIAAIRLLLFTGARLNEILSLKWNQVNLERAVINLPDSKTGMKPIYLNSLAIEVLENLPRVDDNPYVIVGKNHASHLVNLRKPWYRIRAQAGIEDLRIHDLRHSFASMAVSRGLTLPLIGKLLGHHRAATTERYAHLADDPVRAANEQVAQLLAQTFKKGSMKT